MSSDLVIDLSYDDAYSDFIFAPSLNYSDWNGRQVTWRDLPEVRSEMERRIMEIYDSGNQVLAYQLATLYFQYTHPHHEIELVKSSKTGKSGSGTTQSIQYYKELQDRLIEEQKQELAKFGDTCKVI